jgi:hypothetical protein
MILTAFPWVRFLPERDAQSFVVEFAAALDSAEPLRNPAQVVTAWRHTAEVHADPELLTILRQDGADRGPVPMPLSVEDRLR